nr:circadian locomotor output cycles kaput [Sinonovacula constricta]
MNYGKRIALSRSTPVTDSDSAIGEDYEDDFRNNKRAGLGKDKMNRNMSEKKRRDQFNMLVNELSTMVSTSNKKMDKSTVLKSTIAFLKNHQETTDQAQVNEINEDWKPSFLTNDEFMHLMLEAMDSFLLVFTQQGIILYASESVTSLLGHLPGDMVNKSIYDYISDAETASLHNMLYNYRVSSDTALAGCVKEENQLSFDCNFRCGTVDPKKAVCFEPVTIKGSFKHSSAHAGDETASAFGLSSKDMVCFCSTVRLQSSKLVREMSIADDDKEFTSRHSLEWKFLFLDHRAPPIIGYLPFEVLGTSGYDYYHPDDLDGVTSSHEQLMKTGEGVSCYYRFLTKGQQWIWLKTRYFITYHQWNSKPEFINCTNTVVSYADVRSQKRKEMGIIEEDSLKLENITQVHSAGSVTSGGRSNKSSSPTPETDNPTGCSVSSKDNTDGSPHPTSTTHLKSRTALTVPGSVYMTPIQRQLHEQLQRKAQQVQDAILRQQEELRKITQQLIFAQGAITMPSSNNGAENMVDIMSGNPSMINTNAHTNGMMSQGESQQQQQQQHISMVTISQPSSSNMLGNQQQEMTFSMLPSDADLYLSLSDTADSTQ